MNLSNQTINFLKNFALINNSIHIDEEGYLKTKTPNASNIIGIAKIDEKLPTLSIYSLDELLGSMSLFEQSNIEYTINDDYIIMTDGKMKINYRLSDPEHILTKCKAAKQYEEYDDFDCSFKLTEEQLISIQKASRILKADAFCIDMKNGQGKISLINSELPMTNSFELEVKGKGESSVKIWVDNLLIMNSDYTVNVSNNKVVKFSSDSLPVFYMLATAILN